LSWITAILENSDDAAHNCGRKTAAMATVTVYRFRKYDIASDQKIVSRRMATRESINAIRGEVIEGTGVEIDDSRLDPMMDGMTPIDFLP
jgi:hypothetical protein